MLTDPARLLLFIGLLCVAASLCISAVRSHERTISFRRNFFDPWPAQRSLAEEKAANPGFPVHTVQGYYQETGLDSLDSTQMHFTYETDGTGIPPNQYIHNEVHSTDFDVVPIRVDDIKSRDGGDQIWQIKPKQWGLCAIGVSTSTYEVNPRTVVRYSEQAGAFVYKKIYVDPPLYTPKWFSVHFEFLLSVLGALGALIGAVLIAVVSEYIKTIIAPAAK